MNSRLVTREELETWEFLGQAHASLAKWEASGALQKLVGRDRLLAAIVLDLQQLSKDKDALNEALMAGNWVASPVVSGYGSSLRPPDAILEAGPRYGDDRDWGALKEEIDFVLAQLNQGRAFLEDVEKAWCERGYVPPPGLDNSGPIRKLDRHRWLESRRVYDAINALVDLGFLRKAVRNRSS